MEAERFHNLALMGLVQCKRCRKRIVCEVNNVFIEEKQSSVNFKYVCPDHGVNTDGYYVVTKIKGGQQMSKSMLKNFNNLAPERHRGKTITFEKIEIKSTERKCDNCFDVIYSYGIEFMGVDWTNNIYLGCIKNKSEVITLLESEIDCD